MKIDTLLAQFLYQNKHLSLPGIGSFTLDKDAVIPDETARVRPVIEGISFSAKTNAAVEDMFVDFIKDKTGKMKPLAQSDLDSYSMLAMQFLNIGKPFFIEGIGTLNKVKEGVLVFEPGAATTVKTPDISERHAEVKRSSAFYEEDKRQAASGGGGMRKLLVLAGVGATVLIIIWGGLYLYERNTGEPEPASLVNAVPDTTTATSPVIDTSAAVIDSSLLAPTAPVATTGTPPGSYKFVFETTNKTRALKRYNALKEFSKTQIETADSITYKIFMVLARNAADTNKVKDSLNAWYFGSGPIKVKIEQ